MFVQIRDHVAQIDVDDYPWFLENGPWYVSSNCGSDRLYVQRNNKRQGYKREFLHRLLLNPREDQVCDHISGDSLDNRRSNLRVCMQAQNLKNRRISSHNTSGFKGVYRRDRRSRWEARITADRRRYYLGTFDTAKEAAEAYDRAAVRLHGGFACTNASQGLI